MKSENLNALLGEITDDTGYSFSPDGQYLYHVDEKFPIHCGREMALFLKAVKAAKYCRITPNVMRKFSYAYGMQESYVVYGQPFKNDDFYEVPDAAAQKIYSTLKAALKASHWDGDYKYAEWVY